MSPAERNARAYCLSIGADPDAKVKGWLERRLVIWPRWMFYRGASA